MQILHVIIASVTAALNQIQVGKMQILHAIIASVTDVPLGKVLKGIYCAYTFHTVHTARHIFKNIFR